MQKQTNQVGILFNEPDSRRSDMRGLRFLSFSSSRFNCANTMIGTSIPWLTP